ncbi:methylmalonyl Co-A mutase-associated GTPase MeaB [bacterium]|nr:methylmalonyl Co-A mutase-associated GTPase MeaB [bacterium]
MPAGIDPAELRDETRLGRLLTRVEQDPHGAIEVLQALPKPDHPAYRLGVTGPPGVGKSTLLERIIQAWKEEGHRVAALAVDPTSAFTGGAILADRLRMAGQAVDGVFVRSLASRGSHGGLPAAAPAVARVLEAAGYDHLIVETVGIGQTGHDVISLVDTVLVLLSPEGGDWVQAIKAGLLEVGDVYAVNKSDRPGAEAMLDVARTGLDLSPSASRESADMAQNEEWTPPVHRLVATTGEGVAGVLEAIEAHRTWLAALPHDHPRKLRRIADELKFSARAWLGGLLELELSQQIEELAAGLLSGKFSQPEAIEILRAGLKKRI